MKNQKELLKLTKEAVGGMKKEICEKFSKYKSKVYDQMSDAASKGCDYFDAKAIQECIKFDEKYYKASAFRFYEYIDEIIEKWFLEFLDNGYIIHAFGHTFKKGTKKFFEKRKLRTAVWRIQWKNF